MIASRNESLLHTLGLLKWSFTYVLKKWLGFLKSKNIKDFTFFIKEKYNSHTFSAYRHHLQP